MRVEEIFINEPAYSLSLTRFLPEHHVAKPPIVLIHGAIENGKIFYSNSGKGLAPFLSKLGYEVFVLDQRGRGKSHPKINRESSFGNFEMVTIDFPLVYKKVKTITNANKQIWMGHSWGGVLILHFYARFKNLFPIDKMVFFGSKRRITVQSLKRYLMVEVMWRYVGRVLTFFYGYFPAALYKYGSDNESKGTYLEADRLVVQKQWDDIDGFSYAKFYKNGIDIPLLSITGSKDDVLGHPHDCKELVKEANASRLLFKVIGKNQGFLNEYNHINLLTHKDAVKDHFQLVSNFLK